MVIDLGADDVAHGVAVAVLEVQGLETRVADVVRLVLQLDDLFGRQRLRHRRIDAVDPGLDHLHRPTGKGELGGVRIDPGGLCGIAYRRIAPPVKRRRSGDSRGQLHPQLVQAVRFAHGQIFGP